MSSNIEDIKEEEKKEEPKLNNDSFECNICFDTAQDPVVTVCGHLYCWECIYKWMKSQQNQLIQCPVCKAGLSEDKLIPIYGRSSSNKQHPKDLPNRPKAQRPEAPRNPHFIPQTNTVFGIHFGFGGFHFGEGFQFGFPFPEQQQIQNDPQRQAMSRFLFALAFVVLMSIILF